jgi:hypothetical protein
MAKPATTAKPIKAVQWYKPPKANDFSAEVPSAINPLKAK